VKPATAKRELLQGDRVGDTCRFSMSFHAKAGDTTPQLATVVAVDEESCVVEVERGEPPRSQQNVRRAVRGHPPAQVLPM
jgi:hypothetical protein